MCRTRNGLYPNYSADSLVGSGIDVTTVGSTPPNLICNPKRNTSHCPIVFEINLSYVRRRLLSSLIDMSQIPYQPGRVLGRNCNGTSKSMELLWFTFLHCIFEWITVPVSQFLYRVCLLYSVLSNLMVQISLSQFIFYYKLIFFNRNKPSTLTVDTYDYMLCLMSIYTLVILTEKSFSCSVHLLLQLIFMYRFLLSIFSFIE